MGKIAALAMGIFDVVALTTLLTKLGASLEYYEPYAMVKSYLYQHVQSLGRDRDKLNFRNPKERDSKHKGDSRSSKRKSPASKRDVRDPKIKRLKPLLKKCPHMTNSSEKRAARKARTLTTRIKTVDSNQVIMQMRSHRTSSVRVADAIPIWDKRHPRKRATRGHLKSTQVQYPRAKCAHATF